MKHNGIISFWKFVFSIIIVIFHVGYLGFNSKNILFEYGSIGVDFFFIVSGYLLANSISKEKESNDNLGKDTFKFISKKFKGLFPYVCIAFILDIVLQLIVNKMPIRAYIFSIFDVTLLSMFGFRRKTEFLGQVWYISAMLICMALIYPQIKKHKNNYFYYIAPLSILFLSGILFHFSTNLRSPKLWLYVTYKGVIRGYFEICIGTLIWFILNKIKNIDFTKLGKFLLTFIELSGFILVVLMSNFYTKGTYDYILVILLMISVFIAFSGKSLEYNLFNNKFCYFLEKLSLPIYLLHYPLINFLKYYMNNYYLELLVVITLTIGLSYLTILLVNYLKKKDYFIPNIKKYLIKE